MISYLPDYFLTSPSFHSKRQFLHLPSTSCSIQSFVILFPHSLFISHSIFFFLHSIPLFFPSILHPTHYHLPPCLSPLYSSTSCLSSLIHLSLSLPASMPHLSVQRLPQVHVGLRGAVLLDPQQVASLHTTHPEGQGVTVRVAALQSVDLRACGRREWRE